jgi:hypothetical protein
VISRNSKSGKEKDCKRKSTGKKDTRREKIEGRGNPLKTEWLSDRELDAICSVGDCT